MVNRLVIYLVTTAFTAASIGVAQDTSAVSQASQKAVSAAEDKAIVIGGAGGVDTALLERVRAFVAESCMVPIRSATMQELPQGDAKTQADAIGKVVGPGAVCTVLLADLADGSADSVMEGSSIGIVNIGRLRSADKPADTDEAKEAFARLVDKNTMRMVGRLIGLPLCPFPRCAMLDDDSPEMLELRSRNFCPPCQGKAEELLSAKGFVLSYEGPAEEGESSPPSMTESKPAEAVEEAKE